ncbi:Putative superoxide reductase (fragment) [uncultured Eubacteriales bacterium]|uniref:Putative superoxide reductase n=1 Tax=uncultured Eubacteriales bacterium TaxID=172733 RepID=A0A212K102_9FIRM
MTDKLTLHAPAEKDEALVWAYRQAFMDRDEHVNGSCDLGRCESYPLWLVKVRARLRPETTPPGLVPATTLMALRESDGALVGFTNIRHCLNDHFLNFSGHIGYSVHPAERRKGYASEILRLAMIYAKAELDLDRVLVTCDKKNEASRRTICSQGGVLENERPCDGILVQRYWIDT